MTTRRHFIKGAAAAVATVTAVSTLPGPLVSGTPAIAAPVKLSVEQWAAKYRLPRARHEYADFVEYCLRSMAKSLNVPYETLVDDYKDHSRL
jgi:hypothetical protein